MTNEEVSTFIDEGETNDDIYDDHVVETEAGVNKEPVTDLKRDEDAPEDEPEAAIPWKQKF